MSSSHLHSWLDEQSDAPGMGRLPPRSCDKATCETETETDAGWPQVLNVISEILEEVRELRKAFHGLRDELHEGKSKTCTAAREGGGVEFIIPVTLALDERAHRLLQAIFHKNTRSMGAMRSGLNDVTVRVVVSQGQSVDIVKHRALGDIYRDVWTNLPENFRLKPGAWRVFHNGEQILCVAGVSSEHATDGLTLTPDGRTADKLLSDFERLLKAGAGKGANVNKA